MAKLTPMEPKTKFNVWYLVLAVLGVLVLLQAVPVALATAHQGGAGAGRCCNAVSPPPPGRRRQERALVQSTPAQSACAPRTAHGHATGRRAGVPVSSLAARPSTEG